MRNWQNSGQSRLTKSGSSLHLQVDLNYAELDFFGSPLVAPVFELVMGQWFKLLVDLSNAVEDYLELYVEKVRIRNVCVAWNSYLPKLPNHQVKQLPWLLHPLDNNSIQRHHKKVYAIYVPELRVARKDIQGILLWARITLPPRTEFADVVQYRPNEANEEYIVRKSYDLLNVVHESDSSTLMKIQQARIMRV
ncbi:hypothetical protein LguiA_013611 [Lonicera macranthoides]